MSCIAIKAVFVTAVPKIVYSISLLSNMRLVNPTYFLNFGGRLVKAKLLDLSRHHSEQLLEVVDVDAYHSIKWSGVISMRSCHVLGLHTRNIPSGHIGTVVTPDELVHVNSNGFLVYNQINQSNTYLCVDTILSKTIDVSSSTIQLSTKEQKVIVPFVVSDVNITDRFISLSTPNNPTIAIAVPPSAYGTLSNFLSIDRFVFDNAMLLFDTDSDSIIVRIHQKLAKAQSMDFVNKISVTSLKTLAETTKLVIPPSNMLNYSIVEPTVICWKPAVDMEELELPCTSLNHTTCFISRLTLNNNNTCEYSQVEKLTIHTRNRKYYIAPTVVAGETIIVWVHQSPVEFALIEKLDDSYIPLNTVSDINDASAMYSTNLADDIVTESVSCNIREIFDKSISAKIYVDTSRKDWSFSATLTPFATIPNVYFFRVVGFSEELAVTITAHTSSGTSTYSGVSNGVIAVDITGLSSIDVDVVTTRCTNVSEIGNVLIGTTPYMTHVVGMYQQPLSPNDILADDGSGIPCIDTSSNYITSIFRFINITRDRVMHTLISEKDLFRKKPINKKYASSTESSLIEFTDTSSSMINGTHAIRLSIPPCVITRVELLPSITNVSKVYTVQLKYMSESVGTDVVDDINIIKHMSGTKRKLSVTNFTRPILNLANGIILQDMDNAHIAIEMDKIIIHYIPLDVVIDDIQSKTYFDYTCTYLDQQVLGMNFNPVMIMYKALVHKALN